MSCLTLRTADVFNIFHPQTFCLESWRRFNYDVHTCPSMTGY